MKRLEIGGMMAKCADVCMLNQAASVFGESDSQDDTRFTANRDAEPIEVKSRVVV